MERALQLKWKSPGLRNISQSTLVVGVKSDVMFPFSDQGEAANSILQTYFVQLNSINGRDMITICFYWSKRESITD
jgi:homoserine acetyltransferase